MASAYELHAYKGTAWAIERGLEVVGFRGATVIEGVAVPRHDGTPRRDGSVTYGLPNAWALFDVELDLGNGKGFDGGLAGRVLRAIEAWKRKRCHLNALRLRATLSSARTALAVEGEVPLHVNVFLRDGRQGVRDGTVPRATQKIPRRNAGLSYDGTSRRQRSQPVGLSFAPPPDRLSLSVSLRLSDRRGPGLRYNNAARHDGSYRRDHRGAVDCDPVTRPLPLADRRSAPATDKLYGAIALLTDRAGARDSGTVYGQRTIPYFSGSDDRVVSGQTVWDGGTTLWDGGTTTWQ